MCLCSLNLWCSGEDSWVMASPLIFLFPFLSSEFEMRCPKGKKLIQYKNVKLEKWAPYMNANGLVSRLTLFEDPDCKNERPEKNWELCDVSLVWNFCVGGIHRLVLVGSRFYDTHLYFISFSIEELEKTHPKLDLYKMSLGENGYDVPDTDLSVPSQDALTLSFRTALTIAMEVPPEVHTIFSQMHDKGPCKVRGVWALWRWKLGGVGEGFFRQEWNVSKVTGCKAELSWFKGLCRQWQEK